MSALSLPQVSFNVDTTLGPAFIGHTLAAILYGISNVQIYIYFQRGSGDHMFMKSLIFLLWILDTMHVTFYAMTVYFYCITGYMNPLALLVIPWHLKASYIVCIVSDSIIIGIYTWRIWKLDASRYVWFLIVVEAVGQLLNYSFGLAYVALATNLSLPELNERFGWLFYVEFSGKAFGDIFVAAFLCLTLWKMRTGIYRTDSLIRILMTYSINTCALTSIVTIGCIIALAAAPQTLVYVAITAMQPKIVLNSMLAFLNSRQYFRDTSLNDGAMSVHLSKLRFTDPERDTRGLGIPSQSTDPASRVGEKRIEVNIVKQSSSMTLRTSDEVEA